MRLTREGVSESGCSMREREVQLGGTIGTLAKSLNRRGTEVRLLAPHALLAAGTSLAPPSVAQAGSSQAAAGPSVVPVAGQPEPTPEPIPEHSLDAEEARVAHGLKLLDAAPRAVSFDFDVLHTIEPSTTGRKQ